MRALFEERADTGDTTSDIWVPGGESVDVAADGTFTLTLPDVLHDTVPLAVSVIAPTGAMVATQSFPVSTLPSELDITAKPAGPFVIGPLSPPASPRKLTGRVLDTRGKEQASNLQLLVWARHTGAPEGDFHVVLSARTDRAGYFSGVVPPDQTYQEAYGVVGGVDETRQPVLLLDRQLPAQLVLLVDVAASRSPAKPGDTTCACDGPVPRAPDPIDLVRSPESFSNDVGGGRCVDFTTPNRTIEEYSFYTIVRTTEPLIKAKSLNDVPAAPPGAIAIAREIARAEMEQSVNGVAVQPNIFAGPAGADPTIHASTLLSEIDRDPEGFTPAHLAATVRSSSVDRLRDILKSVDTRAPDRHTLTTRNPVDWDSTPTFYQATTVAHGHSLHLKQVWRADGYSMGDLLYSLPLAPTQKKQVVIVDWTRDEQAMETQSTTSTEALTNQLSHARDVSEVIATALSESMRGGSSSSNWGVGGGLGGALGGSMGFLSGGAVLGVAGGGGSSSSSSWQDSTRDVSGTSLQQLRDLTQQSASAVRDQRSTVVRGVRQGERMTVESDVVTNHNHCHAITMEYFEVLRHMVVTEELVDVQECLFIPLMLSAFDSGKTLRWRTTLEPNLLVRNLAPGFAAIDRMANAYLGSDLPNGRYADETMESVAGELTISFYLSRPKDQLEKDAEVGAYEPSAWRFFGPWFLPWTSDYFFRNYLRDKTSKAERDAAFEEYAAPLIAQKFVDGLRVSLLIEDGTILPLSLHPTLVSDYVRGTRLTVSFRSAGAGPGVARAVVKGIVISGASSVGPTSKVVVNSASFRYSTPHLDHPLVEDPRVDDDLGTGTVVDPDSDGPVPTVDVSLLALRLDAEEKKSPRDEDSEVARRLLAHLNERIEHYHRVLWWNMDPQRRFMLLDGFVAPNCDGRSIASVVENRLLAIVGNSLVMPVARGFRLDPTYESHDDKPVDLLALYQPTTPLDPMRVSLPTAGVFAEAVMGSCNSCEKKDDTRFWRFEESPSGDEPTAIQSPATDSRRAEPGNLSASPFPSPIINLQAAPSAPDPTGLGSALQVLGTPNLFRDASGLEQTQKNALASMQSALDAAQQFGGQAAQLAAGFTAGKVMQQQQSAGTIDKTMQSIKQAQSDGLITQGQASGLSDTALRQMVGAPNVSTPLDLQAIQQAQDAGLIDTSQAQSLTSKALSSMVSSGPTALTDNPTINDALKQAADTGRGVSVKSGDQSVELGAFGDGADTPAKPISGPLAPSPKEIAACEARKTLFSAATVTPSRAFGLAVFQFDIDITVAGVDVCANLKSQQWIKGSFTLHWQEASGGGAKRTEVISMEDVTRDANNKRLENDGWYEDIRGEASSGWQSSTLGFCSCETSGTSLHYHFNDAPGRSATSLGLNVTIAGVVWMLTGIDFDISVWHQLGHTDWWWVGIYPIDHVEFTLTGTYESAIVGGSPSVKDTRAIVATKNITVNPWK